VPDWNQRRVLIAGGSAGFGKALAFASLARGAETFVGARDPVRLEAFASEARAAYPNSRLHVRAVDVMDPEALQAWFGDPAIGPAGLDVVASVVGRSERGNILDATPEQLVDSFRVNVVASFLVAQHAAPALAMRKGTFVTVGSLASKIATPYLGAYPPAKFALAGLTQQLRWEFEPLGIRTLLVTPGPIARDDAGERYSEQALHLPEAARRPGGGAPMNAISPAELADKVFRAIERGDLELVEPRYMKWLFAVWQVAPGLAKRIVARRLKRKGG
jgi:NAD(P)-dependent dehydrogenase (short-subunit alcohol dehydrogenase family)